MIFFIFSIFFYLFYAFCKLYFDVLYLIFTMIINIIYYIFPSYFYGDVKRVKSEAPKKYTWWPSWTC